MYKWYHTVAPQSFSNINLLNLHKLYSEICTIIIQLIDMEVLWKSRKCIQTEGIFPLFILLFHGGIKIKWILIGKNIQKNILTNPETTWLEINVIIFMTRLIKDNGRFSRLQWQQFPRWGNNHFPPEETGWPVWSQHSSWPHSFMAVFTKLHSFTTSTKAESLPHEVSSGLLATHHKSTHHSL